MVLERLKQFIDSKGISISAFEKSIGMSNASFGKSLKNKGAIGSDKLENILNVYPELNSEWLLTGKGSMLIQNNALNTLRYSQSLYSIAETKTELSKIPVMEMSMAAGDGFYNLDYVDIENFIVLPRAMIKEGKEYVCGTIKGDSMHPTLQNNSYLVIHRLDTSEWLDIKDEYVYVVSTRDGRTFVKRLKNRLKKYGFIVCKSDNPDKMGYPNFNLNVDEINTIWYADWYLSAKMPNIQETYYNKQSELENEFSDLKSEFEQIKKYIKSQGK